MTSEWRRSEPRVALAGDCGGDVQVGDAWSARWSRPLTGGLFAVVDRYYYPAEKRGRRWLEQQTAYLVCKDPQQPGDTEVWSDGAYEDLPEADPRRAAESAPTPTDEEWAKHAPSWYGIPR